MEDIRMGLEKEIASEIEKLKELTPGTKEHSEATDSLVKLYKLSMEETEAERAMLERADREFTNSKDLELKQEQLKAEKLTNWVRAGIDTAGVVLPMIFYAVWMRKGFKFEETGTFTSTTFRGLFQKFRPTR